ncbi:MAG: hypothetical protein ACYTEG_11895 [Planctomycetota bacterium]|jgi:hypothetical protein
MMKLRSVRSKDAIPATLAKIDELNKAGFKDKTVAFQLLGNAAYMSKQALNDPKKASAYAKQAIAIGSDNERFLKFLKHRGRAAGRRGRGRDRRRRREAGREEAAVRPLLPRFDQGPGFTAGPLFFCPSATCAIRRRCASSAASFPGTRSRSSRPSCAASAAAR